MVNSTLKKRNKAKSIGPCQPARNAQADVDRYFSQMHYALLSESKTQLYDVLLSIQHYGVTFSPHPPFARVLLICVYTYCYTSSPREPSLIYQPFKICDAGDQAEELET